MKKSYVLLDVKKRKRETELALAGCCPASFQARSCATVLKTFSFSLWLFIFLHTRREQAGRLQLRYERKRVERNGPSYSSRPRSRDKDSVKCFTNHGRESLFFNQVALKKLTIDCGILLCTELKLLSKSKILTCRFLVSKIIQLKKLITNQMANVIFGQCEFA